MTRRSRRLAALGAVLVLAAVSVGVAPGVAHEPRLLGPSRVSSMFTPALAGKVTFTVSLRVTQQGPFAARGAVSDKGLARGRSTTSGNKVRMTFNLDGRGGRIKLLVTQVCGKKTSTWTVLVGSGDYRGMTGAGKGIGKLSCGRKAPHRGVYTGTVRTPPATAAAQPGEYRGSGFSPNTRVSLEVLPDGRTVTNVAVRQLVARCQPAAVDFLEPRFTGRYPLSSSGRFTIETEGYEISGKISGATGKGSIAYNARGCTVDSLNWTASTPPAPLPDVSPGRYCGFTLAGSGVCVDATRDAFVTRIRFEVKLRCFEPEVVTFPFEYIYAGAFAVQQDRTFSGRLSDVPLPGGGSLNFSASGKFDDADRVSGEGGFSRVSVVKDGTRYRCRNAVSSFTAKRGA